MPLVNNLSFLELPLMLKKKKKDYPEPAVPKFGGGPTKF